MVKVNQDDYAYATGRIRAREIKLLESSRFDRMLDAPTAEEAFKVLTEAEYGTEGDNTGNISSLETVLSGEMKKTYALLSEIAPHVEVVQAFQRRHDFFNVKVLLKAEFSEQDTPPILVETGTFDKETIQRMIRERDYEPFTPVMRQAIVDVYDVFSRQKDPQAIDLMLDKASFGQLVADLNAIDNDFLHELSKMMVDIANIKMFIRARVLNKAWDFLKKLLLDGGEIAQDVFYTNSDKDIDNFVNDLRHTQYGETVRKGWELYKTRKNISGLEKLMDDFQMEFIRRSKLITMGVEPFIAYLFAKEAEIRNVRIIMTGKINKLPVDLIRERLRLVYV